MTQEEALDVLKLGNNAFITGAAGTGKTYLLNEFIEYLKEKNVSVAVTASTGISATHLNGITIHSWSGIHIDNKLTKESFKRIQRIRGLKERIRETRVLIIDEISMLHDYRLDMVDEVCRKIRGNQDPFGGIQVVLSGDFFQLPPVQGEDEPNASFAVASKAWKHADIQICYLKEQFRQDDTKFIGFLNQMRDSQVQRSGLETLNTRLNKPIELDIKVTQLFTTNADVDAINNYELNQLESDEHQFTMASRGIDDLVKKLKKGCMASEDLRLKIGAIVLFVKNNFEKGYVNGTLGEVIDFDNETGYPLVKTVDEKEIIAVPERWVVEDGEEIIAQISQVPLRLAWAITVHKSQGMSLDAAIIDLSKAFVEGMGYVALSRVRRLKGIKLLGLNEMALKVHPESVLLDRELREKSHTAKDELKRLGKREKKKLQKQTIKKMRKK